jgi:hypothetical protein
MPLSFVNLGTYQAWHNRPFEQFCPILPEDKYGRLRHAMWVSLLLRDGDRKAIFLVQFCRDLVFWVTEHLALEAGLGAHGRQEFSTFSCDGYNGALSIFDAAKDGLQVFEVAVAEWAPVAAVD